MSNMDDETLNETFWNDPAATLTAFANEIRSQTAADIGMALHQSNRYREQAAELAGQHNLVTYGETPAMIAETLASVVGSLEQQERQQATSATEAENEAWREQVRKANAGIETFRL